jgi:hypothetical protein
MFDRMRTLAVSLALLVCLGAECLLSGCASQSEPAVAAPTLPALGPPPWTPAQVSEFLRPAYLDAQGEHGRLLVFMCMPSVDISTGRRENAFDCTGAYESGAKGVREITLNERGEVVGEEDVQSNSAVNPGQACTSRPDIEPTLPDCADVQVQVADGGLPPVDASLYGTGDEAPDSSAAPDSPAGSAPAVDSGAGNDARAGGVRLVPPNPEQRQEPLPADAELCGNLDDGHPEYLAGAIVAHGIPCDDAVDVALAYIDQALPAGWKCERGPLEGMSPLVDCFRGHERVTFH